MRKVYQTKFDDEGNCFAACLASILEEDINKIPHLGIDQDWVHYQDNINAFLRDNYFLQMLFVDYKEWEEYITENFKESYYIVSGDSSSGYEHAVVYKNGSIYHDPNPAMNGIKEPKYFYIFLKLHF